MHAPNHGHSVIVYSDMIGGWYFAEIDGKTVYRFGPLESHKLVRELVVVIFPEIPLLELVEPSVPLDDSALMILGNAQRAARITEVQENLRELDGAANS
ncbi:hypothetical protein [Cupriavidus basilensis]|uniref:hypothetical protein n=1 Tax=Cupriavidus basilensis TaxID=68895 RepID=UPI0023E8382D|nr:hypothetical protein [Cupriavidus basilensis]MDF3887280.1 hypothetical protein [Cupriavidus basilensis]